MDALPPARRMATFSTMTCTDPPHAGCPGWLRHDPASWPPGTLDRDGLYGAAERLAAQPGFAALAQAVAREVLSFLDETPVAMRVVRDLPMYLLLVCCMYLHHRRDPADPAGGVSLRNLRQLYTRRGTRSFAADSHMRDMLAWARLRGLLRPAAAADARMRRLEPTELMQTMFQRWLRAFVRGGALVLPPSLVHDGLPSAALVREVLCYRIDGLWVDGYTVVERHPQVAGFMQRRHGYHVFLALLSSMAPPLQPGPVPLSVSALAARFQVARGTVRNNLALLAGEGLLLHDGTRAQAQLLPPFAALARHWMATEITWMSGLTRAAARSLAAPAQPPVAAG